MLIDAVPYLLVLSGWFQVVAEAPATPETLEAAIGQLGAADFAARQAATDFLWRAGQSAEVPLQTALRSTDPEIRARAAALLSRLRLGIRPDTPPEVAALIDQYRLAASDILRRQALAELQAKGQWQAILTLVRGERDAVARLRLASAVAPVAGKLIRPLIERGDLAEAEQVLELVAISEPGVSQLAAFLVLTGRLDEALAKAKQHAATAPSAETWTRLAYLARAAGDLEAASAHAAKTDDLFLQANLHAEARQWDKAAGIANELFRRNPTRLETAAFAATFYRLAGNAAEAQRTIAALLKAANVGRLKENPPPNKPADPFGAPSSNVGRDYVWTAAETLLINERVPEAREILRKSNPRFAHVLLWRQHQHQEALQFVGITPERALDRAWFDQLPASSGDAGAQQEDRFLLAMQVARQLRELGRKEQLAQILETLHALAEPMKDRGRRLAMLAALKWQLGRYDDVPSAAAQAIAAGSPHPPLFSAMLKQQGAVAAFWYDFWLSSNPQADREKLFARAVWLVAAQPPAGRLPADWRQLVVTAEAAIQNSPEPGKAQRLMALGQTCEIRGERALARNYYLQAAALAPSLATRAGDWALSDHDWQAAAEAYERAANASGGEAIATYLHGYCLTRVGETEAGQRQIRLAALTALAPEARVSLAEGLQERGLKREAIEQLQLVRRTALPDSPPAARAGLRLGSLLSSSEPGGAADAWEQLLLNQLNSNNFTEVEGYLAVGQIIHKKRAIAAATSGDATAVAAELDACERLLPGDVQLVVELVPLLHRAGLAALADKIAASCLAAQERVIEEFPTSATYLNNSAWVCARTQRQLDRALELVERALALAPEEASYLDTLAEVHFQRGDRDAAVAAARRAAELAPHNRLFAVRLKHFQEDELKTLDAGEME